VIVYLDASVLVALMTNDALSDRADTLLRSRRPELLISDFAAAEFASALARSVRTRTLPADEARIAFSTFDAWSARVAQRIATTSADVRAAEAFLRRLDLTLRTPDALNIAIAQRASAVLATFDAAMANCARALQTEVLSD